MAGRIANLSYVRTGDRLFTNPSRELGDGEIRRTLSLHFPARTPTICYCGAQHSRVLRGFDMVDLWWIPAAAILLLVCLGGVWFSFRNGFRRSRFAEARRLFHRQRERLEAKFVQQGTVVNRPDSPRWIDCEFDDDVAYAWNRSTAELNAFVAVTIELATTLELRPRGPAGRDRDWVRESSRPRPSSVSSGSAGKPTDERSSTSAPPRRFSSIIATWNSSLRKRPGKAKRQRSGGWAGGTRAGGRRR